MAFNFGPPKTVTGFTLPTTSATTPAPGFPFGASGDNKSTPGSKPTTFNLFPTSNTPSSNYPLGGTIPAKTTTSGGFSYNVTSAGPGISTFAPATPTTSAGQFNLGLGTTPTTSTVTTTAPLSFGFGTSVTSTPAGFNLSTSSAATTASSSFALSSTPSTSAAGSLSFKLPTSVTPSTGTGLLFPTATSTVASTTITPSFGLTSAATGITTSLSTPVSTTTATTSIPQTGTLTYTQLEDAINKWTIDLEDQGKLFSNQAKQLNAWDRLLSSNGEKIMNLNNGIERVKQQQQQLDQALDFILAQQKELEDLIIPLENELNALPVTDQDRNRTYQLAEGMDSQLKQMSEDLKEIIEHLNECNKSDELSDPIVQVGRILNTHMNSLQWIDKNTAQISSHLDQISKMQDINRRNNNYNF